MLSFICPPIGRQYEPWLRPGASRFNLNNNPLMDSYSVTRLELRHLVGKNRARTFVPFGTSGSLLCGIDGKANGQTRPSRSAHAGIAPQGTDFSGFGEALRLDQCPGSSRSSGRWSLDLLYAFQSMDELLISGMQELRTTLNAALENQRKSAKRHESVIAFSRAMFDHAYGYRNVYFALLNTGAWPIVRHQLQEVLAELIRREC